MKRNALKICRSVALLSCATVFSILPTSCSNALLRELTPFVIDGSNTMMESIISFAAPFVLP